MPPGLRFEFTLILPDTNQFQSEWYVSSTNHLHSSIRAVFIILQKYQIVLILCKHVSHTWITCFILCIRITHPQFLNYLRPLPLFVEYNRLWAKRTYQSPNNACWRLDIEWDSMWHLTQDSFIIMVCHISKINTLAPGKIHVYVQIDVSMYCSVVSSMFSRCMQFSLKLNVHIVWILVP